jgi:CO/xanthine dehydrogenase FAD-binding subunit
MRCDPADYELVTPGSLQEALKLLAEQPNQWLPIAGGTDVMVLFAAGMLAARRLLSVWNLPELCSVEILPTELRIGAGCTYTDVREHLVIAQEFPLLARAASWTGGIANQNRGTLGGNIANASPAADSLPALLAYEAELILVSVRGERRLAYRRFHTGYKKTNLAADELIRAICLPRRFSGYVSYTRKVGARSAQAISKICIAALGRVEKGVVQDLRIALGSVAPVLQGKPLDGELMDLARRTAAGEAQPIDDIRSSARYRAAVVSNLVGEFLDSLAPTKEDLG